MSINSSDMHIYEMNRRIFSVSHPMDFQWESSITYSMENGMILIRSYEANHLRSSLIEFICKLLFTKLFFFHLLLFPFDCCSLFFSLQKRNLAKVIDVSTALKLGASHRHSLAFCFDKFRKHRCKIVHKLYDSLKIWRLELST